MDETKEKLLKELQEEKASESRREKEELLKELETEREYFAKNVINIKERDYALRELLTLSRPGLADANIAKLLFGLFGAFVVACISASLFGFGGFVTIVVLTAVILISMYVKDVKKYEAQTTLLSNQISTAERAMIRHYEAYKNPLVSMEDSHPQIIGRLIEILRCGQADNFKEAINYLSEERYREKMLQKQEQLLQGQEEICSLIQSNTNTVTASAVGLGLLEIFEDND